MKKSLIILVAASLFFGFACNKKEQVPAPDTAQSLREAVSGDWDKSGVNSLLQYVPEDTSMVYASTRGIDLSHPMMKPYLTKLDEGLQSLLRNSQSYNDIEGVALDRFYAALIELATKHEVILPEWGLDSLGRADMVIYSTGTKLVAKMTLVDGKMAKAKFFELFNEIEDVAITDIKIGDQDWVLIGEQDSHVMHLALHFSAKELTLSLVLNTTNDMAYLNTLLTPVAKPLNKEALGKPGEQTLGLGYFDNVKLIDEAFNENSDLFKLLRLEDEGIPVELCAGEFKTMAEAFPRVTFATTMHVDEIHLDSILKIKNSDTIAQLKSLLGKRIPLETATSTFSVIASLDVGKSIAVLGKWASAISQDPYNCPGLAFINDSATTLAGLPVLTSDGQFKFVNNITGLGLSLASYEVVGDTPIISASAYILGSDLIEAAYFAQGMIGSDIKQVEELNLQKDVVIRLDLSELADMPFILQAIFTDKSVVITKGEDVDIVQVSKLETVAAQDLLNLSLNYAKAFSFRNLKINGVQHINISIVDDGIKTQHIMKF